MKIVFTLDQIYLHGGIEKVVAQRANYFSDVLHHQVFIVTTEQNGNKPRYDLSSNVKQIDIGVNYNRSISYFNKINLIKIPFHFKQWRKTIGEINPDVIIVCNFAVDFYWTPFFFRKISKIKEYHSSRYFVDQSRKNSNVLRRGKYLLNDFIESQYSTIVLLNPDEKPFYKTANLVVIPNPIEPNNLRAALQNKKVICAGRIAPVKGFEVAITAWKQIAKQEPNWELHIYGSGEDNYIASLKKIISANDLGKVVFIKPAVNNLTEQMIDYSIYLMSSKTECFPMVLLESLSIGLPTVSFDCPTGPRNIITDREDGLLVEDQNTTALAENVLLLIRDKDLRITFGHSAKQNVFRFSSEKVMAQWNNLFFKLQE